MELNLSCECGQVTGTLRNITPNSGNRLTCYCNDCQNFATQLNQEQRTLNDAGGTDVYQIPPSHLNIQAGIENLRYLKLSKQGIHRWYAKCCNSPVCNAPSPTTPVIGVIRTFISDSNYTDDNAGKPMGALFTQNATRKLTRKEIGPTSTPLLMFKLVCRLISWAFKNKGKKHPLYTESNHPISPEAKP